MLTDSQQAMVEQLVDGFENHGAVLRVARLDEPAREDLQALILAGLAEVRPPGPLDQAVRVIPTAKARRGG